MRDSKRTKPFATADRRSGSLIANSQGVFVCLSGYLPRVCVSHSHSSCPCPCPAVPSKFQRRMEAYTGGLFVVGWVVERLVLVAWPELG